MRALLVVLAGCWSSTAKPEPVEQQAPTPAPRYSERVTARPLDVYEGDGRIDGMKLVSKPPAPWEAVVAGYFTEGNESSIALEVVVRGKRYVHSFSTDDGGDVHILRMHDITPGGAQEILIQASSIADGGETRSLTVCGIGPSNVPSCADAKWTEIHDLYQPSQFDIATPSAGGVRIAPKPGASGKTQYIGFDFP